MNGAEAVLTSLKNEGVDVVFGYPGGAVLTLYDAVYKMKFPHILTRHEQGAVHAADGYARATGKVGVVFATSGPGATNLVTGISTAYTDSVPLVCITGQVANPYIGKDSFQEADVCGITTPITMTTVPTIATGCVNPAEAPDEPNGEEMMFPALSYQIAPPASGKAPPKSEKPP